MTLVSPPDVFTFNSRFSYRPPLFFSAFFPCFSRRLFAGARMCKGTIRIQLSFVFSLLAAVCNDEMFFLATLFNRISFDMRCECRMQCMETGLKANVDVVGDQIHRISNVRTHHRKVASCGALMLERSRAAKLNHTFSNFGMMSCPFRRLRRDFQSREPRASIRAALTFSPPPFGSAAPPLLKIDVVTFRLCSVTQEHRELWRRHSSKLKHLIFPSKEGYNDAFMITATRPTNPQFTTKFKGLLSHLFHWYHELCYAILLLGLSAMMYVIPAPYGPRSRLLSHVCTL